MSVLDEKRKKRNRQKKEEERPDAFEIPPIDGAPQERRQGKTTTSFEIPPIHGAPGRTVTKPKQQAPAYNAQKPAQARQPDESHMSNSYMAYLMEKEKQEKLKQPAPSVSEAQATTKVHANVPDLNSDVLLRAVEYAQILQPPKAYQYMATRSVRGDWQNYK